MVQHPSSFRRVLLVGAGILGVAAFAASADAGPTTEQFWAQMGYDNPEPAAVVPLPAPGTNVGDPAHAINGTAQRRIQNFNQGNPQP